MVFQVSNTQYGGFQFYIGSQLLASFSATNFYFGTNLNGITPTKFNYLANVTSDIQQQINNLGSVGIGSLRDSSKYGKNGTLEFSNLEILKF
jgi:hypothetical protein